MKSFNGKVLLVTGGSRGIGEAVARGYVARGGKVAFVGLEPDLLAAIAADLGDAAAWWEADVRDASGLTAAIDAAAAHFGHLDHVLANAGIISYGTLRQVDEAAFTRVIDINVNGVYRTIHAAAPHLIASKGHLLVVASLISFTPVAGLAPYAASKAAAESLAIAARQELAPFGVAVGSVHPSWIDTDIVRGPEADLPTFKELRTKLPWPTNGTITVEKCADAILRGFAKRKGRVYVRKAVALTNYGKGISYSAAAWPAWRWFTGKFIADLEADVERLGRQASEHTPD